MFTNWIQKQGSGPGEFVVFAQRSVIFRDVLCALVQILEVAVRQLLAPPRTRPGSRLSQISNCAFGQEIRLSTHSASILVFEVEDRLLRKPAMPQVFQPLKDIQGDSSILHVLPN